MKKWIFILLCLCSCVRRELEDLPNITYCINVIPQIEWEYKKDPDLLYDIDITYQIPDTLYEDIFLNDTFSHRKIAEQDPFDVKHNTKVHMLITSAMDQITTPIEGFYENVEFITDISKFEWIDNNTTIVKQLKPIAEYYIIQIIIKNCATIPNCDSLKISGLSSTKNLLTDVALNKTDTADLKILPYQQKGDSVLYASKFLSFGLPSAIQDNYSWDITETLKSKIMFKCESKHIVADITRSLLNGKHVLTIELDYSQIKKESGLDISVGNWDVQIINIDI